MKFIKRTLSERHYTVILMTVAFLSLIPTIAGTPLFDEDEGYFAEVSREMLESGNFVTAYLNGKPEYDKPVLIYWLQAASFRVFGLNEFAARLPSALATFFWVMALYGFVRRYFNLRTAFLSGLFLLSAVQITITGKAAISDALLNLFLALTMFRFYDYFQRRNSRYLYEVFLYAGLGFLTKGPVAVVVPAAVGFFFCLFQRRLSLWLRAVFNPVGILIFLAVALPWYVLEYLDQGDAFIQDFFFKHNLERFQSPMEGHGGSLLYFIPVVLIGTLPHSGLWIPMVSRLRTWWRQPVLMFGMLWFGFVFLLFSLAGTKLPHYIIYGYTPLFILYALTFQEIEKFRAYFVPAFLFLLFLSVLPALIPVVAPFVTDRFAVLVMAAAPEYFGPSYYFFSGGLLLLLVAVFYYRRPERTKLALIVSVVFLIMINVVLMPRVGALMQGPVKEAALIARQRNYNVVMWGYYLPSFIFYSRKFVSQRNPAAGDILITKRTHLEELKQYEVIFEKNGIVLAKVIEP